MTTQTVARPASEKTINFINALLRDRAVPEETVESLEDFETWMTQDRASTTIDLLKSFPYKTDDQRADEPGMYEHDGVVYQIVRAKAGHVYAKHLTEDGWEYAVGAMKFLRKTDRISLDRAFELSEIRGQCIRCLRTLTATESVKRSIGPVCRKYI